MLDPHWFQANPDPTGFFNADQEPKPKEKYANSLIKNVSLNFFIKKDKASLFFRANFQKILFYFSEYAFFTYLCNSDANFLYKAMIGSGSEILSWTQIRKNKTDSDSP